MPVPIIAAVVAGGLGIGAAAIAGRSAEQAAEQARGAAREQSQAQLKIAEEAKAAAQMTPEEKAFTAMMRTRAEAGLGAPEFETTTAAETETALEALQKYYMQRGWQPSPRETGLLIEPSQKVARDIAIQNALLRRQAQQQAWERAYQLTPLAERQIEMGAGLQALPYETAAAGVPGATEQQLALGKMEQATAAQRALGGMLQAYASPLFQQRIQQPSPSTIVGGRGGTYTGYQQPSGLPGGQTWSPYR